MKIREIFKNHKDTVIKALKIWGGLALFFLALNIVAYLGIKGLLITLFAVMVITFLILIYLDFNFSLKDQSFALIFRNLNHLNKVFDSVKYHQYGTIDEEHEFIRLLWTSDENPSMDISNLFVGKLHHNKFKFYNVDMGDNKGFVIECEKTPDIKQQDIALLISGKAEIDKGWIKRNKYHKSETITNFNVYAKRNKSVDDALLEKIAITSPFNEEHINILFVKQNKIVLFVNGLYPFHSDIQDKKEADMFFLAEVESIKKQVERLSIILP